MQLPGPSTKKAGDEEGGSSGRSTPEPLRTTGWWEGTDLVRDADQFDMELSGKLSAALAVIKKCDEIGDKV